MTLLRSQNQKSRIGAAAQHPTLCKWRPARQRPHNCVRNKLCELLRQAGNQTDIERAVPALYNTWPDGSTREAILDLYTSTPGSLACAPIDVTISSPHAASYSNADRRSEEAARRGVARRHTRYGQGV